MNTHLFVQDLRLAIERQKISQNELCRLSGIPQSTISKLLGGKMRFIRLDTAIALWPFVYGKPFPAHNFCPQSLPDSIMPEISG